MDRDGLAASVIYGPLALGFPIDDPDAAGRVLRGVERLGGRGVQRGRARPALRAARSCPALARRPRPPSSSAARPSGHRGAIIDVFDIDLGDPAWDRLWAAPQDTGLPISFHIKGGTWSDSATRSGSGSRPRSRRSAAAARRAARDAWSSPGRSNGIRAAARARRVGRRLAAVLPRRAWTWSGTRCATSSTTRRALAERAVPPPGLRHVRGGAARRRAHPAARRRLVHVGVGLPAHRQHVPRVAARDRRDARRRSPRTTAARSPRPTARELYGFAHARMSHRGFDHVSLPLHEHRRDGRVLPRARVATSTSTQHVVVGVRRRPDDQLPPRRAVDSATTSRSARRPRRRRAATSASCGTGSADELHAAAARRAAPVVEEGPVPASRRVAASRPRASTCATPTATSSSS